MIYLEPTGGIGNRMRAIDSAISLAMQYERKLIVLWVKDLGINCSFYQLFQEINDPNIEIVEFPNWFSHYLFYKQSIWLGQTLGITRLAMILNRRMRLLAAYSLLSQKQTSIILQLQRIPEENIIRYAQIKAELRKEEIEAMTLEEIDEMVYSWADKNMDPLFQSRDPVFIMDSWLRFQKPSDNYSSFLPIDEIQQKVLTIEEKLSQSIGLHIRRTDHEIAKRVSTNDKFIKVIRDIQAVIPDQQFFISSDEDDTKQKIGSIIGREQAFYNHISSYNRDDPISIQEGLLDLYCLSSTKRIYGSMGSTFSQVAANISGKEVIYTS